jgi:hypothetical protein
MGAKDFIVIRYCNGNHHWYFVSKLHFLYSGFYQEKG